MADISDVEAVLVTLIAGACYPNGTGAASIAGVGIQVFRGWPKPNLLTAALAAGTIMVSVYSRPNMSQNVSKVLGQWNVDPAKASAWREVRRTKRGMQVSLWCPSSDLRDAIAGKVDLAITTAEWLPMPDGSFCHITYQTEQESDEMERESLFRRDIFFAAEYPMIEFNSNLTPVTTITKTIVAG